MAGKKGNYMQMEKVLKQKVRMKHGRKEAKGNSMKKRMKTTKKARRPALWHLFVASFESGRDIDGISHPLNGCNLIKRLPLGVALQQALDAVLGPV